MTRMFSRRGKWWQLWVTLAIMWTVAIITYGWMNLPRAQQLPHNPQFLSKLSNEAASILLVSDAQAEPARGTLVWSQSPMIVRMPNGARLTFPAPTTRERAALVASEYRQLLNAEADEQRGPYLLAMLAIWLAPWLLLVMARAVAFVIATSGIDALLRQMANYFALCSPANRSSPGRGRQSMLRSQIHLVKE